MAAPPVLITSTLQDQFGQPLIWPYIDKTGYLIVIPTYCPSTARYPGLAVVSSVVTPPTFTRNGVALPTTGPAAPIQLVPSGGAGPTYPSNGQLYFIMYQMPFGAPFLASDVVTMSAGEGWATTSAGAVAGTSSDGTTDTPLVLNNFVGGREFPIGRWGQGATMRLGINSPSVPEVNYSLGQPSANWANRLQSLDQNPAAAAVLGSPWGDTVIASDAGGLPAVFTNAADTAITWLIDDMIAGGSLPQVGAWYERAPETRPWAIVYDDATDDPMLATRPVAQLELASVNQGSKFTVTLVDSPSSTIGTYDASASPPVRRGITRHYQVVNNTPENPQPGALGVFISGGHMNASNQNVVAVSNIRIYPPYSASLAQGPATPVDVDPQWLSYAEGRAVVRFMDSGGLNYFQGNSNLITQAEAELFPVTNTSWAGSYTVLASVASLAPLAFPVATYMDFLGANITLTEGALAAWSVASCLAQFTTTTPHGLSSGHGITISGSGCPVYYRCDYNRTSLVAAMGATTSPVTFNVADGTGLAAGSFVEIDGEALTVTAVSGGALNTTVTANRGTPAAPHLASALVYTNRVRLAAALDATSATCGFSGGPGGAPYLTGNSLCVVQIDDERILVGASTTTGGATTWTITRGVDGTTAAAHAENALVYPCVAYYPQSCCYVTGGSTFAVILSDYTGLSNSSRITFPTVLAETTTYAPGPAPTMKFRVPVENSTVPMEMCAAAASKVAATRADGEGACWISLEVLASDAAVTASVNRVIPYLAPGVKLVVECGNENWNFGNGRLGLLTQLAPIVPTGGNVAGQGAYFGSAAELSTWRQHHYIELAQAAFTAAGLDPNRVINGYGTQYANSGWLGKTVTMCQANGWPIDYIWGAAYLGVAMDGAIYQSWTTAAANNDWSLETMRQVMLSALRVQAYFTIDGAAGLYGSLAPLLQYNAGNPVWTGNPATRNTGLGRYCYYEGQIDNYVPTNWGPYDASFEALQRDLFYDPDSYITQMAFLDAFARTASVCASLATGSIQTGVIWVPDFMTIFNMVNSAGGARYLDYGSAMWWGQMPGMGDGSDGGAVNQFGWVPAAMQDPTQAKSFQVVNDSVVLQAQTDWNRATAGVAAPPTTIIRNARVFNGPGAVCDAPQWEGTAPAPPPPSRGHRPRPWTPGLNRLHKANRARLLRGTP